MCPFGYGSLVYVLCEFLYIFRYVILCFCFSSFCILPFLFHFISFLFVNVHLCLFSFFSIYFFILYRFFFLLSLCICRHLSTGGYWVLSQLPKKRKRKMKKMVVLFSYGDCIFLFLFFSQISLILYLICMSLRVLEYFSLIHLPRIILHILFIYFFLWPRYIPWSLFPQIILSSLSRI